MYCCIVLYTLLWYCSAVWESENKGESGRREARQRVGRGGARETKRPKIADWWWCEGKRAVQ